MELAFGTSAFDRARGNFPLVIVLNMFAEETATEGKISLLSRPGLAASGIEMGEGPVRGLFQADGVLGNNVYGVSGTHFYEGSELVGSLSGDDHVSMAGYEDYLFITAGTTLYGYDGLALSDITFPDGADVLKVATGASRLLAIRGDTQKFYWTSPLGTSIDALSFASAENSPDRLLDLLYVGDQAILFGAENIEFWPATDNDDLPFAPLIGRVYPVGVKATGCAVKFNSSFAWITNRNEICITDPQNVISGPGLETKISESESVKLWTFLLEGTEFLTVTLDTETWVYHPRSGSWSQFETYEEDNWITQTSAAGYFGSTLDGKLLVWSDDQYDDEVIVERRFRAWAPLDSGAEVIDNLIVRCNPGQTPFLSGTYADPTISMRSSRDGGNNWTPWKGRSLGIQGNFKERTVWRSCGMFTYPGMLFEFRVTDPVPFRVSNVLVNEPYGGR